MKRTPEIDLLERSWEVVCAGIAYAAHVEIKATVYEYKEITGEYMKEIALDLQGLKVDDERGEPVDDPTICRMIKNECLARIKEDYLDLCASVE